MTHKPIRDLNVRRAAIFTSEHAFVWASAGTGKTHTLTLRALYLLFDLGHPHLYQIMHQARLHAAARKVIRSLVLTTFTRKAAAEMHERLYSYLDAVAQATDFESLKSSDLAGKDPIFVEILEGILERIPGKNFSCLKQGSQALAECASELQISTIHSLAASILRRHPFESGIPPGARFAKEDEDDLGTLNEQILERWWQKEAFGNPANADDLAKILQLIPVSELREWLELACQRPWLADELARLSAPERCKETRDCLDSLADALENVSAGKAPQILSKLRKALEQVDRGKSGSWTRLTAFLFEQKDYLFLAGKRTPKGVKGAIKELSREQQEQLKSFLGTYSVCLRAAIHRENAEVWYVWLNFLDRFLKWARSAAADELGLVSFDEMIDKAVVLLKTHEAVRRSEFARLRAVLVDEFQDTDPAQLELVSHLLRRPPDCNQDVLGFFVGDTKQSIYRFRGVDVVSVVQFSETYEDQVNPLKSKQEFHLQTNFRSCAGVTDFANYFFRSSYDLVEDTDLLIPFRVDEGPPTEWIRLDGNGLSAEQIRHRTAEATAGVIHEYVSREKTNFTYKDFLILTRSNRELDSLLTVLERADIPVATSGARTYYQQHEVLDLLNLLIALYHPADSVAVAAVLRSPLVRLTDDDIHRLFARVAPERLFHSDDEIPEFLAADLTQRICEVRTLAASRRETPLPEWLHDVQLFIPADAYTRPQDSEGRSIVRMTRLLKAIRDETLGGNHPPLVWLLKQRARAGSVDRWDEDSGEDVNLFDEGVDAVRAMTIHKAKGLEARVVIVYCWTSLLEESLGPPRGSRGRSLELSQADGTQLRALSLNWGPLKIVTDSYLEATNLDCLYSSEEAMRLTYVAVTRACDQLVLLQSPSKKLEKEIDAGIGSQREGQSLPFKFSNYFAQDRIKGRRKSHQLSLDIEAHQQLWDCRRDLLGSQRPTMRYPTDAEFRHGTPVEALESTGTSLATGLLVHRYLEKRLQGDFSRSCLEELRREIRSDITTAQSTQEAEEILTAFFSGRAVDSGGKPLRERVEASNILGQEIPIYLTIDDQPWHGVIDLIMEHRDVVYAVDFKTGILSEPLPTPYVQQEIVYGEALRRLFPDRESRFEFWWLGGR